MCHLTHDKNENQFFVRKQDCKTMSPNKNNSNSKYDLVNVNKLTKFKYNGKHAAYKTNENSESKIEFLNN